MAFDLARLASSNVVAFGITTTGGKIVEANDALLELIGFSRAELDAGEVRWDTITPPEWRWTDTRAIEELKTRGAASPWYKEYVLRDGRRVPVILAAAVLADQPDTTVVFILDFTQQKHIERELAARLDRVREEQLAVLARELHDVLGQDLAVLQVDSAWLGRRLAEDRPDIAALEARIAVMSERISQVQSTVQRLSSELRPPILDDLGLVPAIEAHARALAKRTGIAIELALPDDDPDPPVEGDIATAVFRVYQELATNVIRHAAATRVEIALQVSPTDGWIELQCVDNGIGIDPARAAGRSLGLVGIRERALAFGGTFAIARGQTGGTEASLRLPRPTHGNERSEQR